MQNKLIRISGTCGITAPIVGFSTILTSVFLSPWFRWTENALSDLGVEGLSAVIFNSGLVFSGLLLFVFSMSLNHLLTEGVLSRIGRWLFSSSSIDLCLIGIFSENFGFIHFYVSILFFTLLPLSLLLMGASLIKTRPYKKLGYLAVLSGLLAIITWLPRWRGGAISEFFSAFMGSSWCVAADLYLIKRFVD